MNRYYGSHSWDPYDPFAEHADGRVVTRAEKEEAHMAKSAGNKRGVWIHPDQVQLVLDPKSWLQALAMPYGGLSILEAQGSPGYPRFRMHVRDAPWFDSVFDKLCEESELPHGGIVRMWTAQSTEWLVRFIEMNDLAELDTLARLGGDRALEHAMYMVRPGR